MVCTRLTQIKNTSRDCDFKVKIIIIIIIIIMKIIIIIIVIIIIIIIIMTCMSEIIKCLDLAFCQLLY